MELLYCNLCKDTFSLSYTTKTCHCGECGGHYEANGIDATYYGNATPLGFANDTFNRAREQQPEWGSGFEFTAFVIPKVCPFMVRTREGEYTQVTDLNYSREPADLGLADLEPAPLGNAFKKLDLES